MNRRALGLLGLSVVLLLGCPRKEEHGGGEGHAEEAKPGREAAHGEAEGHGGDEGHEDGGHEEVIQLTPEAMRSAQVQTVDVQPKALAVGLTVPARVAFTQDGVAQVAARVPGRIGRLEVQLGERVKKGQVLGYLESPELGQAQADYLSAVTKARVTEDNFRREKELLAKGITSEREMREAESAFVTAQAERNAADVRLHAMGLTDAEILSMRNNEHYSSRFPARSPLDGTVVAIAATVGQAVEATTHLFTVGNLSELWVLLDVPEAQLATVRRGQPVDVTVPAFPGRRFQGQVQHVGDVIDEKTRTVLVRVAVPNTDGALKPGMYATAEVATGARSGGDAGEPTRLVLPREAVHKVGDANVVFVPAGDNRFRPVEVRLGQSSAKEVEVLSGLEPGTRVVTQGAFVLKSELMKESLGEGHSH
jgi:cobalt-zinc-cadmium efflux system membrane fusion protein